MTDRSRDWQDQSVKVVKSPEGICSIWPAERENAPGWEDAGVCGSKAECLAYIQRHCDASCRLKAFAAKEGASRNA